MSTRDREPMSVEGQSITELVWESSDDVLPPLLHPDDACKDSSFLPTTEHTTRPTSDCPDASKMMIGDYGVVEGFVDVVVDLKDSDEDEEDPLLLFSPFKRRNVLYFESSSESGDDDEDDIDADTSKLDKTVGDHPEDDLDDGSFIVEEGSLSAESSHHGSVQSGDPSSDGNEFTRMLMQKYVLNKKDDPVDADDVGMFTGIDGSGSEDGDDEEEADASGYYSEVSSEDDEWMKNILNKRKRRCRLPRAVVVTGKRNNLGLGKANKKSDTRRKLNLEDTSSSEEDDDENET
jgi:hypothetical protein